MGERIKVVCPTCDGSGWSAQGSTPAGGSCSSCRGEGEVWPERRERLTAAPSMAEVLDEHRRVEIHNRPLRGGRIEHYRTCTCGLDLPWNSVDAEEAHRAHVAQALAAAGFGHVASVEAERDGLRAKVNRARAVCEDPQHTVRRWIDDTRMVDVPAVLAALDGEATP